MPVTDPIADLLTRIRNAQHARQSSCICPWSRHKEEICDVLKRAGYLADVMVEERTAPRGSEAPLRGQEKQLVLQFNPDHLSLTLKRVSTPGRRVYVGRDDLKPVLRGFGMAIVTTSVGVMTDGEAREKGIGGEVLCTVS